MDTTSPQDIVNEVHARHAAKQSPPDIGHLPPSELSRTRIAQLLETINEQLVDHRSAVAEAGSDPTVKFTLRWLTIHINRLRDYLTS